MHFVRDLIESAPGEISHGNAGLVGDDDGFQTQPVNFANGAGRAGLQSKLADHEGGFKKAELLMKQDLVDDAVAVKEDRAGFKP